MKVYTNALVFILLAFFLCIKCSKQVDKVSTTNRVNNKEASANNPLQNDTIKKEIKIVKPKSNQDNVDIHYGKLISLYSQLCECQTYNNSFGDDCLSFIQHIKDKKRIWDDNIIGYKKEMERTTLKNIMKEEKEILNMLKKCKREGK